MEGVPKLLYDLKVSFGVPLVIFVMFWMNAQFRRSRSSAELAIRLGTVFCVVGFVFLFSVVILYQDGTILASLWRSSPIRFTLLYTFALTSIATLISIIVWRKLRPSLWTVGNSESNA